MGAFLEKPKTDKLSKSGVGFGLKYGASAMQGWRMEMEDADVCNTDFKIKDCSFFGVFDGHAGSKVSQCSSEHLLDSILSQLKDTEDESSQSTSDFADKVKRAMEEGFLLFDDDLTKRPPWSTGQDHSGSTAIVAFLTPTHIVMGNCGDSRSIFCSGGKLAFNTVDHKPSNEIERKRIEAAGGTVMMQRVNGTLAVSRALGDFDYKGNASKSQSEQLVSPQPDVTILERNPSADEFLLLACDGIYDVMDNEEVLQYVRHRLELTDDLSKICEDLIDNCLHKNSRDNMSVVLITFPGAPQVSQEAIEKDKEFQTVVEKEITEQLKTLMELNADPLDLVDSQIVATLSKNMTSLPENYNLAEKKPFITATLQELKKTSESMMTRDTTDSKFDAYDQQLLELGSSSIEFDENENKEESMPHLVDEQMDTLDESSNATSTT